MAEALIMFMFLMYYMAMGAYLIKLSCSSFRDGKYFMFGLCIMAAIMNAVFMAILQIET